MDFKYKQKKRHYGGNPGKVMEEEENDYYTNLNEIFYSIKEERINQEEEQAAAFFRKFNKQQIINESSDEQETHIDHDYCQEDGQLHINTQNEQDEQLQLDVQDESDEENEKDEQLHLDVQDESDEEYRQEFERIINLLSPTTYFVDHQYEIAGTNNITNIYYFKINGIYYLLFGETHTACDVHIFRKYIMSQIITSKINIDVYIENSFSSIPNYTELRGGFEEEKEPLQIIRKEISYLNNKNKNIHIHYSDIRNYNIVNIFTQILDLRYKIYEKNIKELISTEDKELYTNEYNENIIDTTIYYTHAIRQNCYNLIPLIRKQYKKIKNDENFHIYKNQYLLLYYRIMDIINTDESILKDIITKIIHKYIIHNKVTSIVNKHLEHFLIDYESYVADLYMIIRIIKPAHSKIRIGYYGGTHTSRMYYSLFRYIEGFELIYKYENKILKIEKEDIINHTDKTNYFYDI